MAEKMYDVNVTRGTRIPDGDGGMKLVGPEKRGGKAVRVSVPRGLGNQIIEARRGEWADGPPEDTTADPAEKAARAPSRK